MAEKGDRRDNERREGILRLTLVGLEEDLDDLREELAHGLSDYEGRLAAATERLPEWLAIEPGHLRALFRFPDDSPFAAAMLGPRAVAIAAARVEAFIAGWVGQGGEVRLDEREEGRLERFLSDRDAVKADLAQVVAEARLVARAADATLGDWLDGIVMELERERESDETALKQLVGEGEVGKGRDARREIADLWEEQRRLSAEVRDAWQPVEELVFEGVDRTVEGVAELRALFARAREGLRGVYPELEVAFQAEKGARHDVDEVGDTMPSIPPGVSDAVDGSPRATEPLDMGGVDDTSDPGHTIPAGRAISPTGEVDLPMSDTEIEQAGATVPIGDEPSEPSEISEVSEVSEVSEPEELSEPSEVSEPVVEPVVEETARAKEEPTEAPKPKEKTPPRYEAVAIRYAAAWGRVPAAERFAVLAPPLAILLGLAAMAGLSTLEGVGVTHPLRAWEGTPWLFGAAVAWLFLVPFARHWRPLWFARRRAGEEQAWAELVRWQEQRHEAIFAADEQGLHVGAQRWDWSRVEGRLYRWESRYDSTFGWYAVLERPGEEGLEIAAPERNLTRWEQSQAELVTVPDDVWQVAPIVFDRIVDRVRL